MMIPTWPLVAAMVEHRKDPLLEAEDALVYRVVRANVDDGNLLSLILALKGRIPPVSLCL
jgi:hypothetical protein